MNGLFFSSDPKVPEDHLAPRPCWISRTSNCGSPIPPLKKVQTVFVGWAIFNLETRNRCKHGRRPGPTSISPWASGAGFPAISGAHSATPCSPYRLQHPGTAPINAFVLAPGFSSATFRQLRRDRYRLSALGNWNFGKPACKRRPPTNSFFTAGPNLTPNGLFRVYHTVATVGAARPDSFGRRRFVFFGEKGGPAVPPRFLVVRRGIRSLVARLYPRLPQRPCHCCIF